MYPCILALSLRLKKCFSAGLLLMHICVSLMQFRPKWHTITTANLIVMHNVSSREQVSLKVKLRTRRAQIHTSWPQHSEAESEAFAAVTCNQLSYILYIFRPCDLLILKKVMKRNSKLQIILVKIVTLKALIMKAYKLWIIFIEKKKKKKRHQN